MIGELTIKILTVEQNAVNMLEFSHFLTGGVSVSNDDLLPNPSNWLPEKNWGEILGSKNRFFVDFVGFWRSNSQMDLAINFYVKFCSRTTNPEVCTTKNH